MICVLVFCQTFLVAKYRVAVDYNQKTVVCATATAISAFLSRILTEEKVHLMRLKQ